MNDHAPKGWLKPRPPLSYRLRLWVQRNTLYISVVVLTLVMLLAGISES